MLRKAVALTFDLLCLRASQRRLLCQKWCKGMFCGFRVELRRSKHQEAVVVALVERQLTSYRYSRERPRKAVLPAAVQEQQTGLD